MYRNCNVSALRSWEDPMGVLLSLLIMQPLEEITVKQIEDATVFLRYRIDQIVNSDEDNLDNYIDLFIDKLALYFKENANELSLDEAAEDASSFKLDKHIILFLLKNMRCTGTSRKRHKFFRKKRNILMA